MADTTSGEDGGNDMKEWVAGFLFKETPQGVQVCLIRKARPEWQKGRLNAVGGKVEPGEEPLQAMQREFFEEAGIKVKTWKLFCEYKWEQGTVWFYSAWWDGKIEPRTMEDEPVMWKNVCIFEWPGDSFIPNLRWLIPMALDKDNILASTQERGTGQKPEAKP